MMQKRKRKKEQMALKWLFAATMLGSAVLIVALLSRLFTPDVRENRRTDLKNIRTETAQTRTLTAQDVSPLEMEHEAQTVGTLVLVNNQNHWDFPESADLVSLFDHASSAYSLRSADMLGSSELTEPLNRMMEAFQEETGVSDVLVVSSYRSYEEQEQLYESSVETDGAEHAARYTAQPGGSEHHTGLALDFQIYRDGVCYPFTDSGDYRWIYDHCADYGFIRRYSAEKEEITGIADESWHFRYVGVPHAALIAENDLCLEEYLELLKAYSWDGEHLSADGYEIYYCSGDTVYVPNDRAYTVSGLNGTGYVVTVLP